MKTVTVNLTWDDEELGPLWMNPDNLRLLLYGETSTSEELLQVRSYREGPGPPEFVDHPCELCGKVHGLGVDDAEPDP